MEEQIIKWIAQRIKDEHRKHARNIENWEEIAARKILATYNFTLRQSDVIKSVCDECNGTGRWKENEQDKEINCPKCNKQTVL